MRFLFFLPACLLALSTVAQGQEKPSPTPPPAIAAPADEPGAWDKVKDAGAQALEYGKDKAQDVRGALAGARGEREKTDWTVLGHYTLMEMWVLTKYGLTLSRHDGGEKSYELEYSRGSLGVGYFGVDIGKIEEQRLSLLWRSYGSRNSFSFAYGIYANEMTAHLGSDYLATVPGVSQGSVELMKLQTLGASFTIGNRWQLKNGFVWGFDWLAVYWPLVVLKQESPFIDQTNDQSKRSSADDAMNVFKRLPAVGAIKVQLGFSF